MPQAVFTQAAIQVVAFFAGVPAGAVATATTVYGTYVAATAAVLQFVALTAGSMAANKLLAPKMPSFSDASLADRTQMVRSPIAARQIVYGQTRVSGVVVYMSTTGTKNEYLHLVIALAGHEVEEIGDVYFNDELALTGAGSAAQGRFTGYADIYKKLGSDTQTVETNLETATSGLTNGKWTSNHRLRGIAYVYVRLTWSDQVWTGGIPNISAMVKGKKVYDPRTTTTVYSANAALCLRDYLTSSTYGLGMSSSEIDDTAFTAAANICDEQVEVKPVTSPATYENRYETNGVLYTSASPDENVGKLLSAMGGLVAYSGGKIVPYAAGYRIPTVTLTDTDFAGGISVQTKTSSRDRVNAVKGVFVSEKSEWQPTDFPPVTSTTFYTQDNSIRYWRDVVLPMTTSSSAAQRIARIELLRARQELTFTARFRLDAMQVRAGDTVMVTLSKFGWSAKVFEVISWNFVADGSPPQLAIEMTLRETASSVYDWSTSDEVQVDTTPTTTLPDPFALDAPTNLTLTADGTTQLIQADGTALPRIKVAWSAPSEEFIQSGGDVVIEYKQGNSTTYLTWSRVDGDQTLDYISSDVRIGTSYDVRIYGLSYFQIATSYLTASVTVAKDTTAPATPTSLTASVGTGKAVSLDWADNTEADLSEYGIYRNTSGVTPASAAADKIAEVRASRFVDTEVTIGTTYYYWVNAYDMLENVSGFSNRATAVPTYVSGGSVDPTAPATPNAPTYASETTYLSTDGTSFARITVTAPAMPSGAIALDILYRRSGASEWLVANQLSSGSIAASIDDLSPGVAYEFAARGISNFGVASAVSSTLSRTAPTNATAPSAPTAAYISGQNGEPVAQGAIPMYAIGVSITAPSSTDVTRVEVKIVQSNSSSDTAPAWYPKGSADLFSSSIAPSQPLIVFFYQATQTTAGFGFARAISRSGVASTWTSIGSVQGSPSLIVRPLGTVSQYNNNDVSMSGVKTGSTSASSVRQINAIFSDSIVSNLTGGALTETFNVSLTNRGFGAKPDLGVAQCASDANIVAAYDFDAAGNSSTNAVIRVTTLDGSNLPAGNQRFSVELTEYT
jgi:hypothetical protein